MTQATTSQNGFDMFRGSIPADGQRICADVISRWSSSQVFVGCSGNFTIERALHNLRDTKQFHGNDVTLYSVIVGRFLAGEQFSLTVNPELADWQWLADFTQNAASATATVMISTRMLEGLGKTNAYYQRMNEGFKAQFPAMHAKTKAKLLALDFRLASFFAGDVLEFASKAPPKAGFVSFPPFFASDYEKMNANLERMFPDWGKPDYPLLTEERRNTLIERIQSFDDWLIGTHIPQKELHDKLIGIAQTTNRGVAIHFYGNSPIRRVIRPAQQVEKRPIAKLGGQTIGNTMQLAKLTTEQFQMLRSKYMAAGIKPGMAVCPIAVLVDKQLVGCFAFNPPRSSSHPANVPEPTVYLLSDFPISESKYPRLSKLILYAALSKEAQRIAQSMMKKRVNGVLTTAFSQNAVSMKYRGLFDLVKRVRNEPTDSDKLGDQYYAQPFMLNYATTLGQWTLQEGLEIWKAKHGIVKD